MTNKYLYKSIIFLSLILFTTNGFSMSIFSSNKEEVVLCSSLEGKITLNGEPASGAKIVRWFKWKDQKGESQSIYADEHGFFALPTVKGELKSSILAQFVVTQKITVHYQANEYEIWVIGKDSKEEFGELGGKPINFRCELSDEPETVDLEDALLMTSCKWDSIDNKENNNNE